LTLAISEDASTEVVSINLMFIFLLLLVVSDVAVQGAAIYSVARVR